MVYMETDTTHRIGRPFAEADHDQDCHVWETTTIDGQVIARLAVSLNEREILWVGVEGDHQGEGHATRLYETATATGTIYHAPEWHRTDDGNAFAYRVGGPSIETCTCCDHLMDDDHDQENI